MQIYHHPNPQLIILGNGFDRHCGLASDYNSFFMNTIPDTLSERFDIKQMKINDAGFWERLLFEYYQQYGNTDYNWCDIEDIIKKTLSLLYIGPSSLSPTLQKGVWEIAFNDVITINSSRIKDKSNCITNPIEKFVYTYCTQYCNKRILFCALCFYFIIGNNIF